jgi:hypothetical protein
MFESNHTPFLMEAAVGLLPGERVSGYPKAPKLNQVSIAG